MSLDNVVRHGLTLKINYFQRGAREGSVRFQARNHRGGRTFGYDNLCTDAGHVVRQINDTEADVVRQIFNLCAAGFGMKQIAIRLNEDGAPSPRAQQGRPKGWAPSSIREVLYRDVYRGQVVWNRSRKRNGWGLRQQRPRPEGEWFRHTSPELRIVTDEQ